MKDKRPIAEQVADLSEEQRKSLGKIFFAQTTITVLLAIFVLAIVGTCVFKQLSANHELKVATTAYTEVAEQYNQCNDTYTELDSEWRVIESQLSGIVFQTLPRLDPATGKLVSPEMPAENQQKKAELNSRMTDILLQKNDLLTEMNNLSTQMQALQQTMDEAESDYNFIRKLSPFIMIITAIIAIVLAIIIEIKFKKKYPYYSDKKYFYYKKSLKQ